MSTQDSELLAQQLGNLTAKVAELERRVEEGQRVSERLERVAHTTSRALQEISAYWDAVYEAMRRVEPDYSGDGGTYGERS